MSIYGNHRFERSNACSACGVTEEALQDNIASKWCTNYQPTSGGRAAMLAHFAAILFLCGAPLGGMTQSDDPVVQSIAGFVTGAVAMFVAQLHAGKYDEFMDSFTDEPKEFYLEADTRRVLNGEESQ